MKKLSIESDVLILSFLNKKELNPYDKWSNVVMKSDFVWKQLLINRFNIYKSINFYEEFKWQINLENNRKKYKQSWTLGCVGKITPLQKPLIRVAKNPYNDFK